MTANYSHLTATRQTMEALPKITNRFDASPHLHRTEVTFVQMGGKVHGLFPTGDLVPAFEYPVNGSTYAVGHAGRGGGW